MPTDEQIALAISAVIATTIFAVLVWYFALGVIGTVERTYGFLKQRQQDRRLRKSEGQLHERRR